jgi:hypothetical protein
MKPVPVEMPTGISVGISILTWKLLTPTELVTFTCSDDEAALNVKVTVALGFADTNTVANPNSRPPRRITAPTSDHVRYFLCIVISLRYHFIMLACHAPK